MEIAKVVKSLRKNFPVNRIRQSLSAGLEASGMTSRPDLAVSEIRAPCTADRGPNAATNAMTATDGCRDDARICWIRLFGHAPEPAMAA